MIGSFRYTFLEHLDFDRSEIHIALVGDLFHGRTAHSKAEGLKVFHSVFVDLIAPTELQMPENYIEKMRNQGFQVRLFASIDEYLANGGKNEFGEVGKGVAAIWYFTRLQLERMSEAVQREEQSLRKAVTFNKDKHMAELPEGINNYW